MSEHNLHALSNKGFKRFKLEKLVLGWFYWVLAVLSGTWALLYMMPALPKLALLLLTTVFVYGMNRAYRMSTFPDDLVKLVKTGKMTERIRALRVMGGYLACFALIFIPFWDMSVKSIWKFFTCSFLINLGIQLAIWAYYRAYSRKTGGIYDS